MLSKSNVFSLFNKQKYPPKQSRNRRFSHNRKETQNKKTTYWLVMSNDLDITIISLPELGTVLCWREGMDPSSEKKIAQNEGLGFFAILGERLLLQFLKCVFLLVSSLVFFVTLCTLFRKVRARELLRLMECSKSMWCFANYNKMWKKICIKFWEGNFNWKG